MWIVLVIIVVVIAAAAYEYRLRRPDQLVLFESRGTIGFRSARWYPRHFSLAIPGTTHLMEVRVEGTAKGGIPVISKIVVTVAPSRENVQALIRVGGWSAAALTKAARDLDTMLQSVARAFLERHPVEDLSSESLAAHLTQAASASRQKLGVEIVTLTVQSIDAVDPSIAEAIRQRESARILEQTETLNQRARVAASEAKTKADEQIAKLEHDFELKRYDLKKSEQEKESELARSRVEDELARSRMKLEFDREEMNLLKNNPELLLLTPQVARLAEASQGLRNARTVVTLSPGDLELGAKALNMFQLFLQNLVSHGQNNQPKKLKKP